MPVSTPNAVIIALAARTRSDGARPLLTYLDASDGSRMELSGTTVANWVAKVSWALDDAGVVGGDDVAMPVLRTHCAHWLPLVWALGAWAAGARIDVDSGAADVGIIGPGQPVSFPTTFALACDIWGRGFTAGALPVGAVDGVEVLGQPDAWRATGDAPDDPEFATVSPRDGRRLVVPATSYDGLRAFAAAILGGGSLVALAGDPSPEVALHCAESERATV